MASHLSNQPIQKATGENTKLDVQLHFHMAGGLGEDSYAKNSSLQELASNIVKNITLETVKDVYLTLKPKSMGMADLGCASGPNTLTFVKEVVNAVEVLSENTGIHPPDFRVYLNDLPTNDFNTLFMSLPQLYRELKKDGAEDSSSHLFVAGCPGSFYNRLFSDDSLQFLHSSHGLHWLSKVPPGIFDEHGISMNKGSVYISGSSPPCVQRAYQCQFKEDFSLFLRLRSRELVTGGKMVLIILGRIGGDHVDRGHSFYWEILSRSLKVLVSKGAIEEKEIDSFDTHFYAPSRDEIEEEVNRNGCFAIETLETFKTGHGRKAEGYGSLVAKAVRAIQGPMLLRHFGEDVLDPLFAVYGDIVDKEVAVAEIEPVGFVIVLTNQ